MLFQSREVCGRGDELVASSCADSAHWRVAFKLLLELV